MGGFHGGHSGGGSHGGGHSSYHGGGSHTSTHVIIGGHHYFHGRRYYGAYYGESGGEPMKFSSVVAISLLLVFLGLVFFFALFSVRVTATITKAQLANDGYDQYEVYDFEYKYRGKTYRGYGDDDANYVNGSYELTILVGEQYDLYIKPLSPSSYEFENNNIIAFLMLFIFDSIGVSMLINAIKTKKEYEKKLAEIGDYNHDGKVDEHDIEAYETEKQGQKDGTYEGMKKATAENVYNREKVKLYCRYCGKLAGDDDKYCSGCGASLE